MTGPASTITEKIAGRICVRGELRAFLKVTLIADSLNERCQSQPHRFRKARNLSFNKKGLSLAVQFNGKSSPLKSIALSLEVTQLEIISKLPKGGQEEM